jgi:hypothetical protein
MMQISLLVHGRVLQFPTSDRLQSFGRRAYVFRNRPLWAVGKLAEPPGLAGPPNIGSGHAAIRSSVCYQTDARTNREYKYIITGCGIEPGVGG